MIMSEFGKSRPGNSLPKSRTKAARVWRLSVQTPDLLTASEDHTAPVWEVHTGLEIARLTHKRDVRLEVFTRDGAYIATASWDGTSRIEHWREEDLIADAGARYNRNLSETEWKHYFGDEPYTKTFVHLP
jgi:WD40 repeat protein